MKSIGITRKVDNLGRIVIPMELRRTLRIEEKDLIEIYVEEDKMILEKFESHQACMITGDVSVQNFSLANGKIIISPECANHIMKELQQYLDK
ncbi:AbrB/MazE/SpoVT family DNA-binding domain-containing protein (plasmid) [Bacillus mycoides]|nr:AbrB/MazE/SpoVT family DNA-binding domain-containing protein [Bacillus mycoides]